MAELLTGFNGKRIFAERASQDSAGDCIRTTYLKKSDLVTVQSDWEETDPASLQYILNKPDLAQKADKTYVDNAVAPKADKTYVDDKLSTKADKTYVDTELEKKADKTYVDNAVAPKADKSYVDSELSGKVDKVYGKGLSTNDFTDAYKDKLDDIDNLPAAQGGSDTTLVTTGDKWTWDNKQDSIAYYLDGAVVSSVGSTKTLTITGSDGVDVVFSVNEGTGAINSITADGGDPLPIDGNKNVDIPLAMSSTAGIYGDAGLVRGVFEEFQQ